MTFFRRGRLANSNEGRAFSRQNQPSKATMSSTAECHLLPCDIEYDGNAPVHIFFRPTAVEGASSGEAGTQKHSESSASDAHNNKTETATTNAGADNADTTSSSNDSTGVLAAQLRGRGLLCVQPTALPTSVVGTVVSTEHATRTGSSSGSGSGVELVGGTFTSIHEWHHEHDIRSLKRAELKGDGVAGRAVEWMEVARSVHDPIE